MFFVYENGNSRLQANDIRKWYESSALEKKNKKDIQLSTRGKQERSPFQKTKPAQASLLYPQRLQHSPTNCQQKIKLKVHPQLKTT